jgi:ComF family protein
MGIRALGDVLIAAVEAFAFYPYCLLCERRLGRGRDLVCVDCWEALPPAEPQWLRGEDSDFQGLPARFSARFSLWAYSPEVERLIHLMKYRNRPGLARVMGRRVACACSHRFRGERGIIVPVPLHRARKRERGYNQSELLAQELAREIGWPLVAEALARVRPTRSQATLSREERAGNVRGAFVVRRREAVQGKRCILVDDVVTTGATANECSRVLLEAGAAEVMLVTVAAA